jgi:gliding motility-associated-like protein
VLVKNGNCASEYSSVVEITVNPNSVGGTITGGDTVCVIANSGVLRLSGYLGSVVQWETSTDNFATVIVPVSNATDTIAYSNLTTTTSYRAQIQNTGCAIAYPVPVTIKVDQASVGGTLTAPGVVCANANAGVLKLAGYNGDILRWETSLNNFSSYTLISNVTDSIEYLNLPVTTYYRTLLQNGVCPSIYSNITAVTVNPASVGGTIIGAKNICIEGNGSQLILTNYNQDVLQWETSLNNFLTYTTVANTTNTFTYSNVTTPLSIRALVQQSPCPAVYSDVFTFIINPATAGGIITGNSQVKKGDSSGPLTLVNFTGGVLEWEYTADTSSVWTVVTNSSNVYSFTSVDTSLYVRVRVKSGNCIDRYSEIFYLKAVNEVNTEIKIYPTISPNADLINDEWIIDNITLYPTNQVRIFNRWGDMVFETRGYDNSSKVWRGQSNTHFTAFGQELPEGTYFYIVDPGNGKPEYSGYVVLNR